MSLRLGMKPLLASAAVLVLLVVAGCGSVYSLRPLYTEKDLVFDPALLGSWIDPSDSDPSPLIVEKGEGTSYKLTTSLGDDPPVDAILEAHLLKLNNHLFLDAVQTKTRISNQEADLQFALPAHIFARVSIQGNTLQIDSLDGEWMEQELKAGSISVPHETLEGDFVHTFVLTGSTLELQEFVLGHADDDKAFSPSSILQRTK